jgi:hypothetical protein
MGHTENENNAAGAPSTLNVGLGNQDIVYRILNDKPSYEKDIEAYAEIKRLESLLNPAWWTQELRDEFLKKMPDVQAAFDSIRGVPNV